MNSETKALDLRDDLVGENKELHDRISKLTEEVGRLQAQFEENTNLIRSIEKKYGPATPGEINQHSPGALVARAASNGYSLSQATKEPHREYGAQRTKIRNAIPKDREFNLEDVASACPEIDRAKVANALWNMTQKEELRVVRRDGVGRRATPVYKFANRPPLAA